MEKLTRTGVDGYMSAALRKAILYSFNSKPRPTGSDSRMASARCENTEFEPAVIIAQVNLDELLAAFR
jgi:hypothetical protein